MQDMRTKPTPRDPKCLYPPKQQNERTPTTTSHLQRNRTRLNISNCPLPNPKSPVTLFKITSLQPPTSTIDTCQLVTPPNASDVRKLNSNPTHHAHMSVRRLPHFSIEMPSRRHKLQDFCNAPSPDLDALSPRSDSSSPGGKHHDSECQLEPQEGASRTAASVDAHQRQRHRAINPTPSHVCPNS
jgi:hypothetical protein